MTYWVHIEDVVSGSTCVKLAHSCATNRCEVTIDLGGDCQFDGANDSGHFSVSAFASTIIGKSLTTYPSEISELLKFETIYVAISRVYFLWYSSFLANLPIVYLRSRSKLKYLNKFMIHPHVSCLR